MRLADTLACLLIYNPLLAMQFGEGRRSEASRLPLPSPPTRLFVSSVIGLPLPTFRVLTVTTAGLLEAAGNGANPTLGVVCGGTERPRAVSVIG